LLGVGDFISGVIEVGKGKKVAEIELIKVEKIQANAVVVFGVG
jgi:hypothetical protein